MMHNSIAGRHLLRCGLRPAVQRPFVRHPPSSSFASTSTQATRAQTTNKPLPTQAATSSSSAAIAGPPRLGWAYLYPFGAPFRAYSRMQDRSPYLTQILASIVIFFLGDLSAQLVAYTPPDTTALATGPPTAMVTTTSTAEADAEHQYRYLPERGLRAMLIGAVAAIPSYKWFLFLGAHFNYARSHLLSLSAKIVVNQAVFTPLLNTYFFSMQALLSGVGLRETLERLRVAVPASWAMSCRVWPLVTAVNFTFVPARDRSVAAGVVAIGWQAYLSWLNTHTANRTNRASAVES